MTRAGVAYEIAHIRAEARKPLQDEIDLTYKMWCGRNFMHLPLHEAIGEAIKATEAEAREDERRRCADRARKHMHSIGIEEGDEVEILCAAILQGTESDEVSGAMVPKDDK